MADLIAHALLTQRGGAIPQGRAPGYRPSLLLDIEDAYRMAAYERVGAYLQGAYEVAREAGKFSTTSAHFSTGMWDGDKT